MKFIPSRELRNRPGEVWKKLRTENELVVTSRGLPVAVMVPPGQDLEETVRELRRARATMALRRIRQQAAEKGLDKLTMPEIDEIIRRARKARRR